jgi:site-specific DNA recombinase
MNSKTIKPKKAVIYCRVSSDRQVREGDGLKSQETRCREYAKMKGYTVTKVFRDEGISGSLIERPAMKDLLAYLDTQQESLIVIIDDISRLARNLEAHFELIARIKAHRAQLESPTLGFGNSSHEQFMTNVMASVAAYQRDANKEQVHNRMKARITGGYWTFRAPFGYRYTKDIGGGGKTLVRDEPVASMIAEIFDGFAAGRFETQMDVAQFMIRDPRLPSSKKDNTHATRIKKMLMNPVYAGYVEHEPWGVSLRQGKHTAITCMKTFEKVQQKLGRKAKAPARKDISDDFPLRGFLLCSCCDQPLTASWSTGRKDKHPYYRCKAAGCIMDGKSLRRDEVEGDFERLLQQMRPQKAALELTKEIVRNTWNRKRREHTAQLVNREREKKALDEKIAGLIGRLLETSDRELSKVYEDHVKQLTRQQQMIYAETNEMINVDTSFEGAVGTVFDFIENPHALWQNGDLDDKRLVLKLAFARKVPYSKQNGLGTAELALPFSVIRELNTSKGGLVELNGVEPLTSSMPWKRSTS